MADGSCCLLLGRAPGRPSEGFAFPSLTAWKGMGARGCPSPPPLPNPVLLLLVILVSGVLFQAVAGLQAGPSETCKVNMCWSGYMQARETLGLGTGQAKENSEMQCMALRTYNNCINNASHGCQGDIRYYSVRNGLRSQMKLYNCSTNGKTVTPPELPAPPKAPEECTYRGNRAFKHCGLFGDPHLRTFRDEFQTCKVKGAWPLVNNEYLTVQVTNDPVSGDSGATATSKLTVIVKKNPRCASGTFQMYQAQTDMLPGTFYDGRTSYGDYKSVELVEVEPGRHVEIHVRYIRTTIVVRQIGRYFTFAIQMPEDVVNQTNGDSSLDLCLRGCPAMERINYQEFLARKRDRLSYLVDNGSTTLAMSREQAATICRNAQLVDFYFDSCVFDLMVTGDRNFTMAALSALQDILRLDPALAKMQTNRTYLPYDVDYGNAAPGRTTAGGDLRWPVLVAVLVSLWALCSDRQVLPER